MGCIFTHPIWGTWVYCIKCFSFEVWLHHSYKLVPITHFNLTTRNWDASALEGLFSMHSWGLKHNYSLIMSQATESYGVKIKLVSMIHVLYTCSPNSYRSAWSSACWHMLIIIIITALAVHKKIYTYVGVARDVMIITVTARRLRV